MRRHKRDMEPERRVQRSGKCLACGRLLYEMELKTLFVPSTPFVVQCFFSIVCSEFSIFRMKKRTFRCTCILVYVPNPMVQEDGKYFNTRWKLL